jgi:hypothetical protein
MFRVSGFKFRVGWTFELKTCNSKLLHLNYSKPLRQSKPILSILGRNSS